MNIATKNTLLEIGLQLDHGVFPSVRNGGFVTPSELVVPSVLGEEKHDGNEKRSATRAGERTTGKQGAATRPWTTGETAPLVGTGIQARYEAQLDAVCLAYPDTAIWRQEDGLWLLTRSSLLPGLGQAAIFLTGISYNQRTVRSWGFWRRTLESATWIGPRHTNFPDGSICAYHPTDGTWIFGDPIVELLDLYTLWTLRHLHLENFGRWPGPQAVSHPYERVLEIKADELCGCDQSHMKYGECCRASDLARNRISDAVNFIATFAGGLRKPPIEIVRSVRDHSEPPPLTESLLFGH